MQMAGKIIAMLCASIYFEILYTLESHLILTQISLASTDERSFFFQFNVFLKSYT